MVETKCGKLYTGISTDVDRRFLEHVSMHVNKKGKGAKFFRSHEPLKIVYKESLDNKSIAAKREYEIKSLPRKRKLLLIHS